MPWQLSIFLQSIVSGLRATQNRRLGLNKRDVSAYALVASFVCIFSVGLLYGALHVSEIDNDSAWSARYFLITGGLLFALINILTLKLFRLLPASIVALMSFLNPLVILLLAGIFTDEILTQQQWFGAGVLLTTILVYKQLSSGKSKSKHAKINFGLAIAFLIAAIYGIAILNEKYLIDRLELTTYLIYGWGMQLLASMIVGFLVRSKDRTKLSLRTHLNVWFYGVLLAVSGYLFVITLVSSDSSSLTTVGASFSVLTTVVLSYILLKERDRVLIKLVSIAVSSVGLFLLFS